MSREHREVVDRVLVVSGLNLDRAWREHDPPVGALLRQRSLDLLAEVVQAGIERECSTIAVLGDLFDRACVRQETLTLITAALEAFPGTVLIAPGARDWYSADSPYAVTAWPANVRIFRSSEWSTTAGVAGSAWTDGAGSRSAYGQPDAPLALRAAHPEAVGAGHLLTSGPEAETGPSRTVVPPLLQGPGLPHGELGILEMRNDGHGVDVTFVTSQTPSGRTHRLDVSEIEDTALLQSALTEMATRAQPVDLIRVEGVLRPGVLLPDYSGSQLPRDDVAIEWGDLDYQLGEPSPDDRSVRGELVRALTRAPVGPRQRHQALALGLQALAAHEGA